MVTRFRDGGVTVTLSGDLEGLVRRAVEAAGGEILKEMTKVAEAVVTDTEAVWYDEVTKRTGKSGKWDVVTTVSPQEVRVGVISLDSRADRRGRGAAWFVHRPGPLSVVKRRATHADFESGKAKASPKGERIPGRGVVVEPNPKAADGKYLLGELVRKPFKLKVKAITPELGRLIAERVRRGA